MKKYTGIKSTLILTAAVAAIFTAYTASCKPTTKNNPMATHGEALPAEYYGWDALSDMHHFFRVITLENELFNYRKPDYDGGFYLRFQLRDATEREYNREVAFDKLNAPIKDYIAHYSDAGANDIGHGFQIPSYNIWYVQLSEPFNPQTFDFQNQEWKPYNEGWAKGILPDPLMLSSRLNVYASKMKDSLFDAKAYEQEQAAKREQLAGAGNERCDMELIEQLKQSGKFDTIIHKECCMLYVNTDLEYYEQPTAPDSFYITYKKFYPSGTLKERRQFLPGIYVSNCMPIGIDAYYDETGALANVRYEERRIFPFHQMVTVDYLILLLEYEGWIDRKTGKGKATMHINGHVDPHKPGNGERLTIRSSWQIQASDEPNSTVGLLASDNGVEVSYIIDKNSRTILKKFRR